MEGELILHPSSGNSTVAGEPAAGGGEPAGAIKSNRPSTLERTPLGPDGEPNWGIKKGWFSLL